jgi:cell division septation protein DedD
VQVAALRERAEAEGIARRLVARGYDAYVVDPQPGGVAVYRVRVGRFADRSEAERVMRRLAQEERFKPWITR